MTASDPRVWRIDALAARAPHPTSCRWHATGGQVCSCGLHQLHVDCRADLVAALTRVEVEALHAVELERRVEVLSVALDLAHADRDHALAALAEREALHAGPVTRPSVPPAGFCEHCGADGGPCSVCGRVERALPAEE